MSLNVEVSRLIFYDAPILHPLISQHIGENALHMDDVAEVCVATRAASKKPTSSLGARDDNARTVPRPPDALTDVRPCPGGDADRLHWDSAAARRALQAGASAVHAWS